MLAPEPDLSVVVPIYNEVATIPLLVDQVGNDIGQRPLLLAIVLFITGIQLFSFGLLAELLMRTYHESQRRPIYRIREVINGKAQSASESADSYALNRCL